MARLFRKQAYLLLILFLGISRIVTGQTSVGINTVAPNENAVLELVSPQNNQGLLIPKLTLAEKEKMASSLTELESGLMVFDVTDTMFYFWNGDAWHEGLADLSYLLNISATLTDSSNSHYNSISRIDNSVSNHTSQITLLDSDLTLLQTAFDKLVLEQNLSAILAKGNSANSKITDLETPTNEADATTKKYVDDSDAEIKTDVTSNTKRISTAESSILNHEARITTNEDSIVNHSSSLIDHEIRITTNESTITSIGDRVKSNETTLKDHETRIISAEEAITNNETRISATESQMVIVRDSIAIINSIAENNKNNINTLRDSVATNISDIATNKQRTKEISDTTIAEILKNNIRAKATSDSLKYIYKTGKVALAVGAILIGANDSAVPIVPSGDIIIDNVTGDVQIQNGAIAPTNIIGISTNGTLGNVLVSKGDGTFEWQDKFAGGMSNNLQESYIWIGASSDLAEAKPVSGSFVLSSDGTTYITSDSVTTRTIKNANVTNSKLDKTNIPISGFANATQDIAIGGYKITDLQNPTDLQDATTKKYVDDSLSALRTNITIIEGDVSSITKVIKTGSVNLNEGMIFIGDANDTARGVDITGSIVLSSNGATYITTDSVTTRTIKNANVTNSKLDKTNIPISGFANATQDIAIGGYKITDLQNPTDLQDATTKKYVDDSLNALRTNITIIEGDVTELFDSISNFYTDITNINDSITQINNDITKIEGDVIELFDSVSNFYTDITNINDSITQINNNITNIEGDVIELFDSVSNFYTDITNINDSITQINNNITNIEGDIIELFDSVSNFYTDITNINDSITQINNDITNIEGDVIELFDSVSNFYTDIENIFDSVTNITNVLKTGSVNLDEGMIFVGDADDTARGVDLSGDIAIVSSGVTTVKDGVIKASNLKADITGTPLIDGTVGYMLISNGNGSFDWANPSSLNVNPDNISLTQNSIFVGNTLHKAGSVILNGDATIVSDGTYGTMTIKASAINSSKIADGEVKTADIADQNVTFSKIENVSTATFVGRNTAGVGSPEEIDMAAAKSMLNLSNTNSGDVTLAGENYLSITNQIITANSIDLSGTNATGTLAAGRFPALTGDITTNAGSLATSYNGVVPSNKGGAGTITGLMKANGSGTVSSAISNTDYLAPNYTFNLGTTSIALNRASGSLALTGISSIDGSAAKLTTAKKLNGKDFDGTADIIVPLNTSDDNISVATVYPVWTTAAGNIDASISTTKLTFLPSTGTLTTATFAGNLTGNVTGNLTGNISGTASNVTGTVAVANGGTGQTSFNDGELLIGNSTGNTLTKGTLTGTSDQINIVNGAGSIKISTPQSIATTSTPTFASLTLNTLKLNTTTISPNAGAGPFALTLPGASGTLALTDGSITADNVPRWNGNNFVNSSLWCNTTGVNTRVVIGETGVPSSYDYELEVVGSFKTAKIYHSSDKRWKKNIQTVDSALLKVQKLRGVTYDWRTEEFPNKQFAKGTQIGLIAQEVEEVLPELVNSGSDGYKAVEYANLVAILIEAIKEQQNQIAKQQQEIDELKADATANAQYMKQMGDMQVQMKNMQNQIASLSSIIQMITPSASAK